MSFKRRASDASSTADIYTSDSGSPESVEDGPFGHIDRRLRLGTYRRLRGKALAN